MNPSKLLFASILGLAISLSVLLTVSLVDQIHAAKYPYSEPINERIDLGITSKATTNGAVRLKLILRLAEVKSFCKVVEGGITIYAMLVAKLATTREIINAT